MKREISQVDNVIAFSIVYEIKGAFMQQHVHVFDHMHLVAHGKVRVIVVGEEDKIYSAGDMILIKAHKAHKLIAETDDAVSFCLHALKPGEDGSDNDFQALTI